MRLSKEQKEEIIGVIDKSPITYGYCESNWTGNTLSDYIQREYNVYVTSRTCQRYLQGSNNRYVSDISYSHTSVEKDDDIRSLIKDLQKDGNNNAWFVGRIFIWHSYPPKEKHILYIKRVAYANIALNAFCPERNVCKFDTGNNINTLQDFYLEIIRNNNDNQKLWLLYHKTNENQKVISMINREYAVGSNFQFRPIYAEDLGYDLLEISRQFARKHMRKCKNKDKWDSVPANTLELISNKIKSITL